ncbi:MAG: alpha/beta hydrolase [Acetobacteraceae bacterium]|nr:alpha/beta hydrolase [Acetobacteraceae bacterium]
MTTPGRLQRENRIELAWARVEGREPTLVFLPGFRSNMNGDKATFLARYCSEQGQAMLRFDYSGHGESGGRFEEGTIGSWTHDSLRLIDRLTRGPLVLVGSSMGGWIALLVALARPERVAGLIGVAAAPDFTERLMWGAMSLQDRERLLTHGTLEAPSAYGGPYPITRALIEDGRRHLLLDHPIAVRCPVRLLHGQRDLDVPWETALTISRVVEADDVQVTLVKDGDHRLSRPRDLALLLRTVRTVWEKVATAG